MANVKSMVLPSGYNREQAKEAEQRYEEDERIEYRN